MKYSIILFLAVVLSLSACSDKKMKVNTHKTEFELYLDYWNEDGKSPEIRFDEVSTDKEVRIDFSKTFGGVALNTSEINVIIDNVRVIDSLNTNYKIESITAFEWREYLNNWKQDVEFVMNYTPIEKINVMLVLDASKSLGDDFNKVKSFSKSFIDKVFTESAFAKIGIVDFSSNVNYKPLTNNQGALENYIDGINQGQFTALYEAMNEGIENLKNSQAEGKAILTFTDGTDNNSLPLYTPSYIAQKLVNDSSEIKINSFTIGFEGKGGVDRSILNDLAANSGIAAFPRTIGQLEQVFEQFSKSIANVYNLTYIRNQQIIPKNEAVKLRFVIKANPK